MKVCGFSIANQVVRLGYPIAESLRSMLPLVDEIVLNIGEDDDETWDLVAAMREPSIKPFRSFWDPNLREGGRLLAQQTNIALDRCRGDWAVYLQADEVLHEQDYPLIRDAMQRNLRRRTQGLCLYYHHFYGSFETEQDDPRNWCRWATRIVKIGSGVRSTGDAADFCSVREGREGRLIRERTGAYVYHYGWTRPPEMMLTKQRHFERLYFDDARLEQAYRNKQANDMYSMRGNLRFYRGTHPSVMQEIVASQDWQFDHGIERQPPDWLRHLHVWPAYYWKRIRQMAARHSR